MTCGDRIRNERKKTARCEQRIEVLRGEIKRLQTFITDDGPLDIDLTILGRMLKNPPRSHKGYCERWDPITEAVYDKHYVIFYTLRSIMREEF